MKELIDFLIFTEVQYTRNVKIADYSSISIGQNAKLVVFPDTKEKLCLVISKLYGCGYDFRIIGNCTNILFPDTEISSVLISTLKLADFSVENGILYAESGAVFSKLILKMQDLSYGGSEMLFGIPGTVGGMLYSNAGANGSEISDNLISVETYDPCNNEILVLEKEKIKFSYRRSSLKDERRIILSACFLLTVKDREIIKRNINFVREKRRSSQPISEPSLGSVFKRTEGYPSSLLVDKCGLKGTRAGGIEISRKHAGFFVNKGNGTARDFKILAEIAKDCVSRKFNIDLEEEVEYWES